MTRTPPILVSLFDLTGYAVKPFTDAGWKTIIIDTQHVAERHDHPRATLALPWEINDETEKDVAAFEPDLIISFPPCTDMAVSGAAHFAKKRAADPDFQKKASHLARAAERIAAKRNTPYLVENPISVLSSLWRKPDFIFQPYEFGGWLPEDDVHPEYPDYIMPRDAYPKMTCYWTGNGFRLPIKKPVEVAPGYSIQHKKLGGKSMKTKNIRSASPRGVFIAIHDQYKDLERMDRHDG